MPLFRICLILLFAVPSLGAQESDVLVADGFEIISPKAPVISDQPTPPTTQRRLAVGFNSGFPLRLRDGRLMIAFTWPDETPARSKNRVCIAFSKDGGKTWVDGRQIDKNPQEGLTHLRPSAIELKDGTLWVFYTGLMKYTKDPATSICDIWAIHSTDGGKTWAERQKIHATYAGLLQDAEETPQGHIVVPFCYLGEPQRFVCATVYSTDKGKTWQRSNPVEVLPEVDADARSKRALNGGAIEPTLVQLADARMMMIIRTIIGKTFESYSTDGGITWSAPAPGNLDCGGTMYIARLMDGRLILVWNRAVDANTEKMGWPNGFESMWVAVSNKQGDRWHQPVEFIKAKGEKSRVVHTLVAEYEPGKLLFTMPTREIMLHCDVTLLLKGEPTAIPGR